MGAQKHSNSSYFPTKDQRLRYTHPREEEKKVKSVRFSQVPSWSQSNSGCLGFCSSRICLESNYFEDTQQICFTRQGETAVSCAVDMFLTEAALVCWGCQRWVEGNLIPANTGQPRKVVAVTLFLCFCTKCATTSQLSYKHSSDCWRVERGAALVGVVSLQALLYAAWGTNSVPKVTEMSNTAWETCRESSWGVTAPGSVNGMLKLVIAVRKGHVGPRGRNMIPGSTGL